MALWKLFRGGRADLDAVDKHDGYVYFCDDGALFFDYKDADGILQRKQITAQNAESLSGVSLEEIRNEIANNFLKADGSNSTDSFGIDSDSINFYSSSRAILCSGRSVVNVNGEDDSVQIYSDCLSSIGSSELVDINGYDVAVNAENEFNITATSCSLNGNPIVTTEQLPKDASTSISGLMSKEDKTYLDKLKMTNLGVFTNKTIADLHDALEDWIGTHYNIAGATAMFTANDTSLVTGWNSGDTTSVISAGSQWTVTIDGAISYNGGYIGLKLASYSKDVYYTYLSGGTWANIYKFAYTSDVDNKLSTTGGTLSGAISISKTAATKSNPMGQDVVINYVLPAGVGLAENNAPGIGFHIGNVGWANFIYDGTFKFANNNFSGYAPVKASKFIGSLEGDADNAQKLGGVSANEYATKTELANAISSAITTALNTSV